jgi:hypothetical protein
MMSTTSYCTTVRIIIDIDIDIVIDLESRLFLGPLTRFPPLFAGFFSDENEMKHPKK